MPLVHLSSSVLFIFLVCLKVGFNILLSILSSTPENEIVHLRTFYSSDDNQNKTHDKKEKKMVVQKPHGTMEYTVSINRRYERSLIPLDLHDVSP